MTELIFLNLKAKPGDMDTNREFRDEYDRNSRRVSVIKQPKYLGNGPLRMEEDKEISSLRQQLEQ